MPAVVKEKCDPDRENLELVNRCASLIEADRPELEDWLAAYARNHCHRIALDLELVERYATKDSLILECGSVPLLLTSALKSLGYDVQGVDIDPSRFSSSISRLGLHVHACNIETEALPLKDESFDVVLFNELFEHLRIDPIATIGEVRRVLRRGGTLLLSTPNLRSFSGLKNFLFNNLCYSCCGNIYDEYSKLTSLGHMGHVREYTTREVREFLRRTGFEVHTLVFRGTYPDIPGRLASGLRPSLRPFVTYVARAA